MLMTIQSRNTDLTQAIRQHIRDRLTAALDQHARSVQRVEVMLEDVNGPRGGEDQVCRVTVHLTTGQQLRHERKGLDLYANVSLIADKVKRRVGRSLSRLKQRRVAR
ncbi:MAG: ribosome hibernation-promoting factor, HPF/YfiA family [Phycisphaeraceae bacterium]